MKQKYTIEKDDAKGELVIREYAELDKEIMSLLCEETYDAQAVNVDVEKGKELLITKLRTRNMYPPHIFADRIAEAVMNLYNPDGPTSAELFFDDKEFFMKPQAEEVPLEEDRISEDSDEIDDLLEEEIDEYGDKKIIKNIKTSIKIAEDEPLDTDDES